MSGYKTWTRERLTSADLQGYIQDQVTTVWASRSARTAGHPAPSSGMLSYLIDEQVVELYRDGAWHTLRQTLVGFGTSGAGPQIATTTLTRLTSTLNIALRLRAGRAYEAIWRAGFTTQTPNQGAVAQLGITNALSTPATTDPMIAGIGYITGATDQPGAHFVSSGPFQVATTKDYLISPWMRRAAVAPATGYVQAITQTFGTLAAQIVEVFDLGTVAEAAAGVSQNPGTIPTIAI